jgi:hypothetical protein
MEVTADSDGDSMIFEVEHSCSGLWLFRIGTGIGTDYLWVGPFAGYDRFLFLRRK